MLNCILYKTLRRRKLIRFTLLCDLYYDKGLWRCSKRLKVAGDIVVAGSSMKRVGFLDKTGSYLREARMEVQLFENVEPDPLTETVMKGSDAMRAFESDWVVSVRSAAAVFPSMRPRHMDVLRILGNHLSIRKGSLIDFRQ